MYAYRVWVTLLEFDIPSNLHHEIDSLNASYWNNLGGFENLYDHIDAVDLIAHAPNNSGSTTTLRRIISQFYDCLQ